MREDASDVVVNGAHNGAGDRVALRCPFCSKVGTFEPITNQQAHSVVDGRSRFFGIRRCPGQECRRPVFVATSDKGDLVASWPRERLDFDSTGLPPAVESALEEAIDCHAAGCYRAAAVMLRRTVEVLCDDRGISGGKLYQRLARLGEKVSINPDIEASNSVVAGVIDRPGRSLSDIGAIRRPPLGIPSRTTLASNSPSRSKPTP